jgi:hypothetical protein
MNSYLALGLILGLTFFGAISLDHELYVINGQTPLNVPGSNNLTLSAFSASSVTNLNLTMILNYASIFQGQNIRITIEESNILNSTNAVNASDNWPLPMLAVAPCGTLEYPVGFAIYQGNYSTADIKTAAPLTIFKPQACPAIAVYISSYTFKPLSDNASVGGYFGNNYWLSINVDFEGNGDWVLGTHDDFTPGVYTVACGDEWGQVVLLHFVVF